MDALAHGREALYSDPAVKDYFPYYQYHTAGDAKVRLEHKRMNGYTARADDPIWNVWTPYKGVPWQWFNCRCIRTAISKYEAEAMGLS